MKTLLLTLSLFFLSALNLGAQKMADEEIQLKVDWGGKTFSSQEIADAAMPAQNEAMLQYLKFASACLKEAKARLEALYAQSQRGEVSADLERDCTILLETVKLKKQEYNLFLPQMIECIDNILNSNVPVLRIHDLNVGKCTGSDCGYVHLPEEIYNDPELNEWVTICYNITDPWVSGTAKKPYCYTLLFIHELHHLRNKKYHGRVSTGQGAFMFDADNFSNMVMRLSVSEDDFEKFKGCDCYKEK